MLIYALTEAIQRFRRAPGISALSILVIAVLVYIFGVFLLVTINLNEIIDEVRNRIEMIAYFEPELDEAAIDSLTITIRQIESVERVIFYSQEDNLLRFKAEFADHQAFLDAIEVNPLPASLHINILDEYKTSAALSELANRIRMLDGIETVQFGGEWVSRLDRMINAIEVIDLAIGVLIAFGGVFIISNTIKLTVIARKDAIEIMRLVGATNMFIRLPILIEGLVQGLTGGVLAAGFLAATHQLALRYFSQLLTLEMPVLFALVGLATLLGATGSYVSMRKFLRI